MSKNNQQFSDKDEASGRYHLLFWGMILIFMVLGARLWYLQVVRGSEFRGRTEANRIETVELAPVRGLITDRDGVLLVENRAGFDVYIKKAEVKDADAVLRELVLISGRRFNELKKKYDELPRSREKSYPLIHGLNREQMVAVETRRYRLDGVSIEVSTERRPLVSVLASHTIGYAREISQRQLDNEKKRIEDGIRRLVREGETREAAQKKMETEINPHRPGDIAGQAGIEQSMEFYLKGRRGYVKREVDARKRLVKELEIVHPEPGYNIRLTLDSRLQAMGQSLLGERAGAIVVMNPNTFEILALASSPTFDLHDFDGGISQEKWNQLREHPFFPMNNRAVAGQYPPGSTFKIVVALAALSEGIITPDTVFKCDGSLKLGNHTFGCHNRFGHGPVDLKKSLAVSCDVYYYEVGRLMGVDKLAKLAREYFGLGRKMGIDLLTEQPGHIPDSAWKLRRHKQRWTPGETLPVAIGQGYVLSTPLQVAQFTAVVANGGNLYRPHLVKEITDVNGQVVKTFEPELIHKIDLPPEYFKAIQKGLEAVVNEPGASGRRAALPNIHVAGKTGTSQVVSLKTFQGYAHNKVDYKHRDHAWFTSYAPAENPEVVVTVLLEHTGGGGTYAAPMARQMLAAYFDQSIVPTTLPKPLVYPDKWNLE